MKSLKRVISPKKLLKSKWTAVSPSHKEKHFIITKLIMPALQNQAVECIEIEAVHTKRSQLIAWTQLNDTTIWSQGWV